MLDVSIKNTDEQRTVKLKLGLTRSGLLINRRFNDCRHLLFHYPAKTPPLVILTIKNETVAAACRAEVPDVSDRAVIGLEL